MNQERRTAALFLAPAILLYGVFFVLPMAQAFYFSLFRWRGLSQNKELIGIQNFAQLAGDPIFWMALKHNFTFLVAGILIT
ncbi:MAG TPA: sugar ABC transporter permease, partial [Armatimonadota bacterium]|nr:sugar ABC transporter permease [Armatimonadota bacterium]